MKRLVSVLIGFLLLLSSIAVAGYFPDYGRPQATSMNAKVPYSTVIDLGNQFIGRGVYYRRADDTSPRWCSSPCNVAAQSGWKSCVTAQNWYNRRGPTPGHPYQCLFGYTGAYSSRPVESYHFTNNGF